MSRTDPSEARGMIAQDLPPCSCGHRAEFHNVTTTTGTRSVCSAWVQGFCGCRRYIPREVQP